MSELSYLRIPKPVIDEAIVHQATLMRQARLLSLQTDPSSFITRYEDEVDQPLQFSINRLLDAAAEHFVAIYKALGPDPSDGSLSKEYQAFLVILKLDSSKPSPSAPTSPLDDHQKLTAEDSMKEYNMGALYVRPTHRGKGVSTRLIQKGIEWVRDDFQQAGVKKAIVHITAAEENVPAISLYLKLGWTVESQATLKDKAGRDKHVVNMTLCLT